MTVAKIIAHSFAIILACCPLIVSPTLASKPLKGQIPDISSSSIKHRLFVLTDIGGDPDDRQSMVRLMTYANQFDIEGLVATKNSMGLFPEQITHVVEAYGKVRDRLRNARAGLSFASEFDG